MQGNMMKRWLLGLAGICVVASVFAGPEKEPAPASQSPQMALSLHVREAADGKAQSIKLRGADARQQLLATGRAADGTLTDLTHAVKYEVAPPGIVQVHGSGLLTPVADGAAVVTATAPDGTASKIDVTVEQAGTEQAINFANRIVPLFTRYGCNSGGCHGKSGGQNGFRLSLLGFEPGEDYEHLVKEARGRRLFPAAPDRSLLLTKAVASLPHGGGKRMEESSEDYKLLVRWIGQGMPYGSPSDPSVARIEVVPGQRVLKLQGEQQLVVLAHYTDGSVQDVTRSALYEANEKELATVDERGLVKASGRAGDVAVMVRYSGKVGVFNATMPLGAALGTLPVAKNFIDEKVFEKLKAVGMPPSPLCDDATFLRRVTVDIAGRLPSVDEVRRFKADASADKRERLIDALLESQDYADYFANKWGALLRIKRNDGRETRGTYAFHTWVRDSLLANKPYDQFVREIVTASGDLRENPPVAWYRRVRDVTAQVEDTAQLFLGMRLKCAQCHHHPFEKWSQQDYFSYAAFFSQIGRKGGSAPAEEIIFHRRGMASATNPKTKQAVKPAGLDAAPAALSADDDPRQALADWLTAKENPFFAKSLVNRYWKHFFGRGLVDPEDDMRETNPPSNPALLDALARHFIDSGYDLKALVRTICRSSTYQLSAMPNEHNRDDRQYFSRYYPRRLTAEVLLDAVNTVAQSQDSFDGLPDGTRAVQLPDNSYNGSSYFLTVFGRPDASTSCECERSGDASLAQSLHLLNNKELVEKLARAEGRAAKLAADAATPDEQKIIELYQAALARDPDSSEMTVAKGHIEKRLSAAKPDAKAEERTALRKGAFEDILWALINTKEFSFNH